MCRSRSAVFVLCYKNTSPKLAVCHSVFADRAIASIFAGTAETDPAIEDLALPREAAIVAKAFREQGRGAHRRGASPNDVVRFIARMSRVREGEARLLVAIGCQDLRDDIAPVVVVRDASATVTY